MNATVYDVAVVGGGLVGASLACALAGRALRVAVIESVPFDADSQPSYDDRSVALARGTRNIFESIGLWSDIGPDAGPIREIHVSDRGHFGAARMRAADYGHDALGYVVENRVLGRVFSAALGRAQNIDLFCPARLDRLDGDASAARLDITHEGDRQTLTARLVVGADGGDSQVRRLAGIGAKRVDYGQTAVIANITPQIAHGNRAWERFTESGPLAMLPMADERCSLVWTARNEDVDRLLALSDAEFLRALQDRFGNRLGRLVRAGARHAYPLAMMRAERCTGTRLALAGNAAHTVHPVAGQGFNLGMRDVAVLAELIGDACARGGDPGAADVLRGYEQWRAGDHRRVIGFTDTLARVFASEFPPLVIARNMGLVAFDLIPPLKKALMRYSMGFAGRLPRPARDLPV
ncbi:MAG: 2-octaprenyl-6-methoxyphenyl hydroxylase [Gammaproteobacteria bacterium]|jgi:2-octaprenyl-6-methoxyphenol hydroxylase|nr:2-octaprenyl-6-methoxyphenyl hydroxylase [Gammaproteobacteria bacterium]